MGVGGARTGGRVYHKEKYKKIRWEGEQGVEFTTRRNTRKSRGQAVKFTTRRNTRKPGGGGDRGYRK